jgi:choice-of-anchor A domain-containing protein
MIPIKRLLFLSSFIFCAGASAQNAVIFQNAYTSGGHSDGGVYVGGSWYGSNYEANQHSVGPFGIYLAGSNYTSNFMRAQGVSYIGGSKGNFGSSLGSPAAPDLSYYQSLSAEYAALPGGVSPNLSAQNNVTLALNNDLTVFNVVAGSFSGYKTLGFTGNGDVVFNVTGNLNSWSWTVNYDPNKITWNFIDATTVNINNTQFTGSIIAPLAQVNQTKTINGLLVANSWTVDGGAELHSYTPVSVPIHTSPIPEPSSVALLTSLAMLVLLRRR